MADEEKKLYAVQFHPEVRHSIYGIELLRQFVFDVCHATGDWSMESFIDLQNQLVLNLNESNLHRISCPQMLLECLYIIQRKWNSNLDQVQY